ncbi:MAG: hypothetical protein JO277_01975, partial [Candidatus Eremiobacteraeota bacterium]|nr:hypothetical protein [Candidatus Eremiobacteraeota bacterium]
GFVYEPPAEIDLLREEGHGLWLIHQFSPSVHIEPLEAFGTHICVELPVSAAAPKKMRAVASARRSAVTG